jgi:hypothetical protein
MNNNLKQHDQLWNGITKTLNNLSYTAAGAISLSVTFLGYVLSINPSVRYILSAPIYGTSTIYLLFLSWIFLFITIFFGIVVQFLIEKYLYNSQTALLFEDSKKHVKEEDKTNVDFVVNSGQASANKYKIASRWIQGITVVSFAFGIFLLMIFVIIIANGLVNI